MEMMEPDRWLFRAIQLQNEMSNQFQTAANTALQTVMEITAHRDQMEQAAGGRQTISADKVALDYNARLKTESIDAEDKCTDNLVDICTTVKKRFLSIPAVFTAVLRQGEQ